MELSIEQRLHIIAGIKADRKQYPSDAKHAVSLGINKAVYSELMRGKTQRLLADANFISIARRLDINLRNRMPWRAAETYTFNYITKQLEMCQASSLSGLLCDIPNIGKTFTAKHYAASHKSAVYVDCGQVKTKMRMIRYLAKAFGLSANGRYADVYDDLVYYLRSIDRPLIILDEAGDINPETFLELKALWNATDRTCGWYMMGANGLKAKIQRNRAADVLGYEEMFSRYGGNYCRATPEDEHARKEFLLKQATVVAEVNAPQGMNVESLVLRSGGGLRRLYTEIEKVALAG